jgi:Sad1 / UNC-like C-terminal
VHPEARSASNILSSKRDRYKLSLCEEIRIDTVHLSNFEFFNGIFKEFTVSVAKTYAATEAEGWTAVFASCCTCRDYPSSTSSK